MRLYRPVGLFELKRVVQANMLAWPPRLPQQPWFYPVLNREYAEQIARDWNLDDPESGFSGFVTSFSVSDKFASQFQTKTVGANRHQELWIPATRLDEFNHEMGPIDVLEGWIGPKFNEVCQLPTPTRLVDDSLRTFLQDLGQTELVAWRPGLT